MLQFLRPTGISFYAYYIYRQKTTSSQKQLAPQSPFFYPKADKVSSSTQVCSMSFHTHTVSFCLKPYLRCFHTWSEETNLNLASLVYNRIA